MFNSLYYRYLYHRKTIIKSLWVGIGIACVGLFVKYVVPKLTSPKQNVICDKLAYCPVHGYKW
jgi:hypothetical protein